MKNKIGQKLAGKFSKNLSRKLKINVGKSWNCLRKKSE